MALGQPLPRRRRSPGHRHGTAQRPSDSGHAAGRGTGRQAHATGLHGAPVSQYGDILIDDIPDAKAVIETAWSHLRERQPFDVMRLAKVRADAAIAPYLAGFGFAVTAEEEAPYADLAACKTYEQFEARSSAKLRKNRRRQLRRLEERGPLETRWLTANDEARDAVRLTMTLKRAWLNHKASGLEGLQGRAHRWLLRRRHRLDHAPLRRADLAAEVEWRRLRRQRLDHLQRPSRRTYPGLWPEVREVRRRQPPSRRQSRTGLPRRGRGL